ncbi:16S rRNA (cytosine(1402)-N(4))-methyltransferase, partial [Salmonella sp. 15E66]|nr:16S rRNA (cytosine(1402)-N(4))-methyltransferase [Salmonella sp. 15E66]
FNDRAGSSGGSRHLPQVQVRLASFTPIGKGVVAPTEAETESNPRARSAKLRAAIRTENPPLAEDHSIYGLPNLPHFHETARS